MNRLRGGIPLPEFRRTTRANDPALRGLVPLLASPTENANQTINKIALTLNRAGSSKYNPILAGLGHHWEFRIDDRDRLRSVYIYQAQPDFGPDRVGDLDTLGGSIFALNFVHGADTVAGSGLTAAVQNFYRVVTAAGAAERMNWVKSYEKDIVNVNSLDALDDALAPVEIPVMIIDATRDWIDCDVDFMISWNDEFQTLHNRNATDKERGNLKAYGGARFVSFFQTGELEGVGTEVNPETAVVIENQHTLQVQNTEGLKHVTARFRSKADSLFYVDIPILIRVIAPETDQCNPPSSERCGEALLKAGDALPTSFMPNTASVPEVATVAGTAGDILARKLMYFAVNANSVGASPTLLVRRSQAVPSGPDTAGFVYEEIGDDEEYIPLVGSAATPVEAPPFSGPVQLMIALDYLTEKALNVALYTIMVKDGDHVSKAITFPGPAVRDTAFMPAGETGGTDDCFYA